MKKPCPCKIHRVLVEVRDWVTGVVAVAAVVAGVVLLGAGIANGIANYSSYRDAAHAATEKDAEISKRLRETGPCMISAFGDKLMVRGCYFLGQPHFSADGDVKVSDTTIDMRGTSTHGPLFENERGTGPPCYGVVYHYYPCPDAQHGYTWPVAPGASGCLRFWSDGTFHTYPAPCPEPTP